MLLTSVSGLGLSGDIGVVFYLKLNGWSDEIAIDIQYVFMERHLPCPQLVVEFSPIRPKVRALEGSARTSLQSC